MRCLRPITISTSSTTSSPESGTAFGEANSPPSGEISFRLTIRARNRLFALILAVSAIGNPWARAETPSSAVPSATSALDDAARAIAKRRDTILYGIEAEIVDLVRSLAAEKNGRYNEELLALLASSRSPKLRSSILDFFSSVEWGGAEKLALAILDDRDNQDADLVLSAFSYLAVIRSKEALRFSAAIIKENNDRLLPILVTLMGRSGGAAEEDLLLGWFDGDSTTPALKEEAIKALGEIGSTKAAERLGKLVQDATAGKAARIFACAALAKIKDDSAVASLVKAANDADPNVRSSAIEALGVFAGQGAGATKDAASVAVAEALRDSFALARIAACKAAGAGKVVQALPFLRYKARSDPEKAVRNEACRSLAILGAAAVGGDDPFFFLRERLADPKEDVSLRVLCFGLLSRYDPSGSLPALENLLNAEAAEKDRSFYTALAREISNSDQAPGISSLARILMRDDDFLIRIAAIEWIRKNRAQELKGELERLSAEDRSEMIRRRATEALKAFL